MDVFLSHPHHPDHGFWASGQIPIIGPSAQPNQRLTRDQWQMLEHHFSQDRKPTTVVKRGIAQSMNVPLEKINNWFQNRRAKARQEQKKAEAAARDGRPLPESLSIDISVGDQQTLQLRPASQPIGPSHSSSLTPPQQSLQDSLQSYPQSTLSSPSEELGCGIPRGMSTSLSGDTSFDAPSFITSLASAAPSCQPLTIMSNESIQSTTVYPSPEQTVFSSPEQHFQVASQCVSVSASQSPERFHPNIVHDYSDAMGADSIISSGPGFQHNSFILSDPQVPDIAFPDPHPESLLTSAMTFADYPPFFGGLSLPSTPTFPDGPISELYNSISSQAPLQAIPAPCEIPGQNVNYLELPCDNDLLNNSVSLPSVSEHSSPDQVMPGPDSAKLFKLRQSSQPNLASRRRKMAPGAIVVKPVGSTGRSGSYTAGMAMPHPLSPRSPLLTAPDQALRRIKSSNNTAGRIQKPMTPAQRSPLVFAFTHNSHLLDDQTPPPSASVVETPSIRNVTYPAVHSMFAPEINFNVPWSAPPAQHEFMFPPDLHQFHAPGILPSTPSPTSHPQYLPV